MKRPLACSVLLAWVCLGTLGARAEQLAPRDIWPQATAAVDSGEAVNHDGIRNQIEGGIIQSLSRGNGLADPVPFSEGVWVTR